MATLTTDFIKVARVGACIDGRIIKESWIHDMAETYNPSLYTAMIWPEHWRMLNFGEVLEVKKELDESGTLCLYARFAPNKHLLEYNAEGQGLFYSIEVDENFQDSGKAYLAGLAVTDSPASLGMKSTRFSSLNAKNHIFIGNVPLEPFLPSPLPSTPAGAAEAEEKAAKSWFKRAFPALFNTENAEEPQKGTPMTQEEILALIAEALAPVQEQVAELAGRVAALEVTDGGAGSDGGSEEYRAMSKRFTSLEKTFASLAEQLKFAARPGTPAPGNAGAAGKKSMI